MIDDTDIQNVYVDTGDVTRKTIENGRIESYVMHTNLRIAPYVDQYGDRIPGLFELLMAHQDVSPSVLPDGCRPYPYTVTKICTKERRKQPDESGRARYVKRLVSFDNVERVYEQHHVNMWMIEIIGQPEDANATDKFVIRFWNNSDKHHNGGDLEVAVFPHTSVSKDGEITYESVESMDQRFSDFINPALYGTYAYEDDEEDDGYQPTYETPDDAASHAQQIHASTPSKSTGIVPVNDASTYVDAASESRKGRKDAETGTSSVVRSVISLILFGLQTFVAYLVTQASAITITFAVLSVLSVVSLAVSIARRSARTNGRQASLALPKALSTLLIVLVILEVVALAAVFVMYRMHALPEQLQFLYTTL